MFHEDLASEAASLFLSGQAPSPKEAVETVIEGQGLNFQKISRVCEATNRKILKEKVSSENGPLWRVRFETVKSDDFKPNMETETKQMSKESSARRQKVSTFHWDAPPRYQPSELVKVSQASASGDFDRAFELYDEGKSNEEIAAWRQSIRDAQAYLRQKRSMIHTVDQQIDASEFDVAQSLSDVMMEIEREAEALADQKMQNRHFDKVSSAHLMTYTAPVYVVSQAVGEGLFEPFVDKYADKINEHHLDLLENEVIDETSRLYVKASSYRDACESLAALREVRSDLILEKQEAERLIDEAFDVLSEHGVQRGDVQ